MEYLGGQGGSGGGAIEWVPLTQAMLDAGSAISTNATMKSASVTDGRLTMTFNAVGGACDGFRETSGIAVPVLDVLPNYNPDAHDILVWFDGPTSTNVNACIACALVNSPGASAVGAGGFVSSQKLSTQGLTSASTAANDGNQTGGYVRIAVSGAVAAAPIASNSARKTTGIGDGYGGHAGTVAATINATDLASVFLFFQAMNFTGTQLEDATSAADICFAVVPKITAPE